MYTRKASRLGPATGRFRWAPVVILTSQLPRMLLVCLHFAERSTFGNVHASSVSADSLVSRYPKLCPAGKASVAAPCRLFSHPQSSSVCRLRCIKYESTTDNDRNAGTSSPDCSGHIEWRWQLELFVTESSKIGLPDRIVKYIYRLLRLELADLPRDRSSVRFVIVIASYDLRKLLLQAAGKVLRFALVASVWVHQPHMDVVASLTTRQYSVELMCRRPIFFIHGFALCTADLPTVCQLDTDKAVCNQVSSKIHRSDEYLAR